MRVSRSVVVACVAAAAAGFSVIPAQAVGQPWESAPRPARADVETMASNLDIPWGIDFLPDGSALITARNTFQILRLDRGRTTVVARIEDAAETGSTGGLLGLAVSPKYREDKTVFVYYSTKEDNRIAKLKLGGKPEPILTGIPMAQAHNGGRIAFGPDGYLYAGTGDAMVGSNAQKLDSLAGKILRLTADGTGAPGNPFPDAPLVYSYGHRDVEGLTWDAKGRMYSAELGDALWDKVNRIEPGKNYGWPICEGRCTIPNPEYVDPLIQWRPSVASPSGIAYYEGSLYVAALRGQRLWKIPERSDGTLGRPRSLYENTYGRLRTVVAAPDGTLWFSTTNRDPHGIPEPGDDRILSTLG